MEHPDSPQRLNEATVALSNAIVRLAAAAEDLVGRIERHERDAESRIEEKLRAADANAADQMERARFAAASLVENQRREIGSLSEEIVAQATALTAGLADGARVRAQFARFVDALSIAAERLAEESADPEASAPSASSAPYSDSGLNRTERTVPLIRTGPSSSISTSRPAKPASGAEAAA